MKKQIWAGSIAVALMLAGCSAGSDDSPNDQSGKKDKQTQEDLNDQKLKEAKTPLVGLVSVTEEDGLQLLEYEVANKTDKDMEIVHSSQQLVEYTISDAKGEVVYRFSDSWNIDKPETATTLVPAQSKTLFSLPLPGHLEPATYKVEVHILTDGDHKAEASFEYDAYKADVPEADGTEDAGNGETKDNSSKDQEK